MIPFHPLADLFPLLEGEALDELVADMRDNGFRVGEEIVLLDGQILDGRNRYRAAIAAGIFPAEVDPATDWRFVQFSADGIDGVFTEQDILRGPLAYVISKNLHRRHLDDRQRASVAGKIANLQRGGDRSKPPIGGLTAAQAAETLNVAPRQVERARVVHEQGVPELRQALDRGEVAVSVAEQIARKPPEEQPQEMVARGVLPSGARAIMSSRQEPDDSLDPFPTPPWATRALLDCVFGELLIPKAGMRSVWEPACGEGHMAEVLREYFDQVTASDVFAYGYGHQADFLGGVVPGNDDWIITNPPFNEKTEAFVLRALEWARVGVAMFVRLQWLETVGRYERIFRDRPPTLISFFAERVNLCKGRWEPEGGTATAYIWLVWRKGTTPRAPYWIPPGQRERLTRPDDVARFTAHPVIKAARLPPHDPETGELSPFRASGSAADALKSDRSAQPRCAPAGDEARASDARPGLDCIGRGGDVVGYAPAALTHPTAAASDDGLMLPAFLKRGADNRPPFAGAAS